MSRNLLKGAIPQLLAWTGVAVLSASIALAQDTSAPADQSQGQPAAQARGPRTDGQIEMDVVHALDASAALKNDLITAATIQSEVTLSGTVSSDASKQLAESISSHVDGVTKVHNNLKVGDPGQDGQKLAAGRCRGAGDADNQQADAGNPGLPPPGPAPDQNPNQAAPYPQQQQYPHSSRTPNNSLIRSRVVIIRRPHRSGLNIKIRIRTTRWLLAINLPLGL